MKEKSRVTLDMSRPNGSTYANGKVNVNIDLKEAIQSKDLTKLEKSRQGFLDGEKDEQDLTMQKVKGKIIPDLRY